MINTTQKTTILLVAVVVIALLAYGAVTMQDKRTAAEKIGDAMHDLPQGVDKAERQMEDRTPGQKLGDAVEDAGEKARNETDSSDDQ